MCFPKPPKPPPPPALPPPPPPPLPPIAPPPEPTDLQEDVNPAIIKQSKSRKDENPYSQGTEVLRIPLDDQTNTAGGEASGTQV